MLEVALVRVPRSPPPRPRRLQFPMRHKGIRSDDDDDSPLLLALLQPLLLDSERLKLMLRLRRQLDDLRAIKLALLYVDLSLSLSGQGRRVLRLCDGRLGLHLLQPKQEHLLLHCRRPSRPARASASSRRGAFGPAARLELVPKWLRFVYGAQGLWRCQRFSQRRPRFLEVPTAFSEMPKVLGGANGLLRDAQGF